MSKIELDGRLGCVKKYVIGDTVCDIGCDHGKLCASLLLNGKIKVAYGVDVSDASLEKSRALKRKLDLGDFNLLIGSGFMPVAHLHIDCGVICGIGSNETIAVIKSKMSYAKGLKRLILCPLKNTYLVREFLFENGFLMEEEDLVYERGRYYNIFIVRAGREEQTDDVNIFVGRRLIENKHPCLNSWLTKRIFDIEKSLAAYDANVKSEMPYKRDHLERMLLAYKKGAEICR